MKRYNAVCGGVYDNSVMVEEHDGDWVWYEDVEDLQSKYAEMLEALKAARNFIAKAEGGSDE